MALSSEIVPVQDSELCTHRTQIQGGSGTVTTGQTNGDNCDSLAAQVTQVYIGVDRMLE